MSHCHTFLEALRQRGYRITPQREMIVEAIAHSNQHMTAEEVLAAIHTRTRSINIATVYRTLDMLVEEGLASKMDLGGGRVVYATARHGPHIHLVCHHCHRVIDAELEPFASLLDEIRQRYGFVCDLHHFAVYGLCTQCRQNDEHQ